MSADSSDVRLSRMVPLDQLREPEQDIRTRRPRGDVKSIAASMGDPDVGQLQDVLAYPEDHNGDGEAETEEELTELFRDGHPMVVFDGETRRQAAIELGWDVLSCTLVPHPPDGGMIAQLDANTERIEMSSFETVRALYEYKDESGATLDDLATKTGLSPSYLSNAFNTFELPDYVVDPWQDPNHPLETSHAIAVKGMVRVLPGIDDVVGQLEGVEGVGQVGRRQAGLGGQVVQRGP